MEDLMTIRPGFWRIGTVIPLGILACMCVTAAVIWWSHQGWALLIALVLVVLMAEARSLPVRLEITGTMVRARQGRWRGQPDVEAPRSEIREIHYYPMRISFWGAGDKPLMEPEPHWTVRQMVKVAAELGVPLYDHKGRLGVEEISEGELVYGPASHRQVR
jgi:hypothetical protein